MEAAGHRRAQPYEAWIAGDPFRGGVRVLIIGPRGFERTVAVALDEAPAAITEWVIHLAFRVVRQLVVS